MLMIGIFGSYQTAQAAEIVAGYGAAQILESILLSFGISIFTADMIQKGTSATWWGTDGSAALKPYYDDLEQAYEEQRFKVINGGGGNNPEPSPTPAPGTSPIPFPTTVPVPGDIPTFKELVAPALAGTAAFINMTQGAWECMGKAVSSLWDRIIEMDKNISDEKNPFLYKDLIGYLHYSYYSSGNLVDRYEYMYNSRGTTSFEILESKNYKFNGSSGYNVTFNSLKDNESLPMSIFHREIYNGNVNTWSNKDYYSSCAGAGQNTCTYQYVSYIPYTLNGESYNAASKPFSKEEIWVHPDLQDTYKNNGKLEYPQQLRSLCRFLLVNS